MTQETSASIYAWMRTVPRSHMAHPETMRDRIKYAFWRLYTPCHPIVRDSLLTAHVIRHNGRQGYLIGTLAPSESLQSFVSFLVAHGYGNHFIAWRDEGEVASLRLVKNFIYQYHIRIFSDGEVRGHYEFTPECYPIRHIKAVGQEDRREEFLSLFGSRVIPAR